MNRSLKVLTYNIHRGMSPFRKRNVVEKIAALLARSGADIVCLQEVWSEEVGSELEALAAGHWAGRMYGRAAVFEHGHQGNAILTRLAPTDWSHHHFEHHLGESRGFVHARLALPEKRTGLLHVLSVHLGLTESERTRQTGELLQYLHREVGPGESLIVAGDFNDWRLRCHRRFEKAGLSESHGRPPPTYPSWWPWFRLDRIYARGLEIHHSRVLSETRGIGLSDHLSVEGVVRTPA